MEKSGWRESRRKRMQIALASAGAGALVRALGAGLRVHCMPWDMLDANRIDGKGLIIALFHGKHFPVVWGYRRRGVNVVTSQSADGEMLARVLKSLGYGAVRGSSTRGGAKAMLEMATLIDAGEDVAMTVDGPRGPRFVVKPGALLLSKITQMPVLPVGAAMNRHWQFNSWDRYQLPKPGARALIVVGEPFQVPADADGDVVEQHRLELESRMVELDKQVEQVVRDRDAIEPYLKKYEAIVLKRREELNAAYHAQ